MSEIAKFKKWLWIAIVGWSLLVCASFAFNSWQSWQSMLNQGRSEGRMAFLKDLSYRVWNASHGGVYVPVTENTQPNPYLRVPQRDVTTTNGQKLTLMNPAFMTRQVFTMSAGRYGIRGHITSLNLLNPGNTPDPWEKKALQAFENNPAEITEFLLMDGEPFMRFMRPLVIEDSCLKCHHEQGYKLGDISGGISVSVPMSNLISKAKKDIWYLALAHGAFLIIGILGLILSNRKITQYFIASLESGKKTEVERERLNVTLRSIGDGVITTDTEGRIIFINIIAEKLTGWNRQEASGKPLQEVFNIINEKTGFTCENPVNKVFNSGKIIGLANHTALIARDGTRRSIADSAAPIFDPEEKIIGVVLVFRDVTQEKKREEELLKIRKLESVGVLAGGIAHDFNNILTAILGNINLADTYIEKGNEVHSLLKEAEKASIRAKDLTQQLLTFSKGGNPVRETASIKQVITDSADFVLHGGNVRCRYALPEDLWLVDIDTGQMSQVIQNLVINARHAMPEGGEIKISCENIADITTETCLSLPGEKYIKITIADNGGGIPEKYLDKIFDPYFSTKQEGSGLGLAVTHSIINKHDGHIFVRSKSGEGATFTIYLPASAEQKSSDSVEEAQKPEKAVRGTILVMDDEQLIQDVAKRMLSRFGHEVLQAKDGREAIAIFKEHHHSDNPVDVIIMDLTIPGGMGGKDAIKEIFQIDPDAKAIVSSGYSNDPVMANYRQHGFKASIGKPFEMTQLKEIINSVLG
jgi:PAS domain S-box-containing protein